MELQQYALEINMGKPAIVIPDGINADFVDPYRTARSIIQVLSPVFAAIPENELSVDPVLRDTRITEILQAFEDGVVQSLENEEEDFRNAQVNGTAGTKNLFEVANAPKLFLSNRYTRVITEKLGHELETIAHLSPRIILPEEDLGFKIQGVDFILYENGDFHFSQLKTKKDTLTGSQSPRSNRELEIHEGSYFVAALDMGSGWTFSPKYAKLNPITRLTGNSFWDDKIGFDYNKLVEQLGTTMRNIENRLFE